MEDTRRNAVLDAFFADLRSAVAGMLPPRWELEMDERRQLLLRSADNVIGSSCASHYQVYRHMERRGDDGLRAVVFRLLDSIRTVEASPPLPQARDLQRVYPLLCMEAVSEPGSEGTLVRPWIDPLNLQYGLAVSRRFAILAGWTLRTMETDEATLHGRALENLSTFRPRFRRVAPGVVGLVGGPRPTLNAAQALIPARMHALATLLGAEALYVAVPSEYLLLASAAGGPAAAGLTTAAKLLSRCADKSLSDLVLRWENGHWQGWVKPEAGPAHRQAVRRHHPGAVRRVALHAAGARATEGSGLLDPDGAAGREPGPDADPGAMPRAAGRPRNVQRAEVYAGFLRDEGLVPQVDQDGDVFFKFEGQGYALTLYEDDEEFVQISLEDFWSIDSEAERRQVAAAAVQANAQAKVAKVYPERDMVSASVEVFSENPERLRPVLVRCLYALQQVVQRFRDVMMSSDA